MTTLADAKFDALRGLSHTGSVNDMMLQWLQAKVAVTASNLPDAWREFLDDALASPTGQFNDDWFQYLGDQGHTGSLNDRELAFWIAQQGPSVTLLFAADTTISMASGPFDASKLSKIEYTVRNDDTSVNRDIWGTDDGLHYGRMRSADFRAFRGGTGGNAAAIAHVQGVEYACIEDVAVAGTVDVTFGALGPAAVGVASTGVSAGAWRIGGRLAGTGMIGLIKDFKIYDSSGTLTNHWPINDNVGNGGEITDIVGGLHGTLTLGAGSWV